VRVFLPDGGWAEFDPTNGLVGNKDLIRVAVVRDPTQATPLWGTWDGKAADYLGMDVTVDVTAH
jgi:transglutaminase-like putative cysteine protease